MTEGLTLFIFVLYNFGRIVFLINYKWAYYYNDGDEDTYEKLFYLLITFFGKWYLSCIKLTLKSYHDNKNYPLKNLCQQDYLKHYFLNC